jgi:hypothetical protein
MSNPQNRIRVNQIIENLESFRSLSNKFDSRRSAVLAYCGSIFDLMAPDAKKRDENWYSNLLLNAQTMVESSVYYRQLDEIVDHERSYDIYYGTEMIGEQDWLKAFKARKASVKQVRDRAYDALHLLLMEILECEGDADKRPQSITVCGKPKSGEQKSLQLCGKSKQKA